MSDVYKRYFGKFSAAILGVGGTGSALHDLRSTVLCTPDSNTGTLAAGDQTANLWWRLQNGDVFTQHPPQVTIILIGTNDLGAASCGTGASGIIAAVSGVVSR